MRFLNRPSLTQKISRLLNHAESQKEHHHGQHNMQPDVVLIVRDQPKDRIIPIIIDVKTYAYGGPVEYGQAQNPEQTAPCVV